MNCLTSLYSHQRAAVDKLLPVRVGALFAEMGTGKTLTAIELVRLRRERIRRVVWFCPISLKQTIAGEILKHTDAAPTDICVFDDHSAQGELPGAFWYIIGIESTSASARVVLAAASLIDPDTYVIVDESDYLKGHHSLRTGRITAMSEPARYRLILTGTPLSQGVVDLYAQMRFLSPRILGYQSFYSFARNHLEYSEKYPGRIVRSLKTEQLAAKIQPYVYQVTKAECLDLPAKVYKDYWCHLTNEQQRYYDAAKDEYLTTEMDFPDSPIAIFRLFTALQEIVSGFWNHRLGKDTVEHITIPAERPKLLMETLSEIPDSAKVIVWCKFGYSIELLASTIGAQYGPESVALLYGKLGEAERAAQIARFRGPARFLLATQGTGGHGLTLTEAHYVVFYENEFKYSHRLQAEDRCHRIGQTQSVTYVDITCNCGIDVRIAKALARKSNVVNEFRRQVHLVKDARALVSEL